jgi:hypothetical protein
VQLADELARYVLLAALIFLPTFLALRKNNTGAGVVGAAIAAALLFTRLPDISSFRLFGLTATLERQTQQVQVTLAELQDLATSLAKGSFDDLAFSGQIFVGLSTGAKFKVHNEIVDRLKAIDVKPTKIREAQMLWISVYANILESMIEAAAKKHLPSENVHDEFSKLPKEETEGLPSPETLRRWVASKSLNDAEISQLLQEYERVWTTGTMNNPDLIPFGSTPKPTNEP